MRLWRRREQRAAPEARTAPTPSGSLLTATPPRTRNAGPDTNPGTGTDAGAGTERTVRLARRRFARRQWTRRWAVWRRSLVAVLLLGVIGAGVWLVFFSAVLAVSGVQVVGADVASPAAVRRAAAVPMGGPLATADLDAVAARVDALPAVQSVDVSRAWPDRVRVHVTERTAVAVVDPGAGGTLRGVDAEGVLFRSYRTAPRSLPVIRRSGTPDAGALAEAASVAGALPADLARRVAHVSVGTRDRIVLQLRSGSTVAWGSADQSALKARVLGVLLPQRAAAYDVSVPGQPVIRK